MLYANTDSKKKLLLILDKMLEFEVFITRYVVIYQYHIPFLVKLKFIILIILIMFYQLNFGNINAYASL